MTQKFASLDVIFWVRRLDRMLLEHEGVSAWVHIKDLHPGHALLHTSYVRGERVDLVIKHDVAEAADWLSRDATVQDLAFEDA